MDKKLLHKNFLRKNFWHKNYCCKNKSTKIFLDLFLKHHFLHQNFLHYCTFVCVTNICTSIFDSKETTHAEINVQTFVTQKMLMQIFLSQKKTRAKINRHKYLTISFVSIMIKGWNYAGGKVRVNEPSFPSPTRGLISRLALYLAAVQLEAFVMKFQFYTLPVPSRPHNSNPWSLWTRTK